MAVTKLTNVRLSFPDLFTPRPFKPGDKPKFKATFLIAKGSSQAALIEKDIEAVAAAKLGAKAKATLASIRTNPNKFCWQDGDLKSYDGYPGHMALTAGSLKRPTVFDMDKSVLAEADGRPYAGCYVNATIEFFVYNNSGVGISASLIAVQFAKHGDAFGGGSPVNPDDFDDVSDDAEESLV
jgi:hypothetical protein